MFPFILLIFILFFTVPLCVRIGVTSPLRGERKLTGKSVVFWVKRNVGRASRVLCLACCVKGKLSFCFWVKVWPAGLESTVKRGSREESRAWTPVEKKCAVTFCRSVSPRFPDWRRATGARAHAGLQRVHTHVHTNWGGHVGSWWLRVLLFFFPPCGLYFFSTLYRQRLWVRNLTDCYNLWITVNAMSSNMRANGTIRHWVTKTPGIYFYFILFSNFLWIWISTPFGRLCLWIKITVVVEVLSTCGLLMFIVFPCWFLWVYSGWGLKS